MQQKQQDQFSKSKKLNYGMDKPKTDGRAMGNFAADQLQQVGYKYGVS